MPTENEENKEQPKSIAPEEFDKIKSEKENLENTLNSLKSKLEALETEKMKASENKDEYIKSLELKLQESNSKFETESNKFKMSKVVSQTRERALKEGVNPKYIDDFQKLYADKLKDVKVNGNFEIEGNSLENLFSLAKEKSSYFFEKGVPKIDDINHTKPKPDNFVDEVKQCKTQKELDAVRKKYNRV